MENASKALLIAGGVLVAILIITTGVILYNNFSYTTKKYSDTLSATELAKFNANFEVFSGRIDITAQEIASLINMVVEYKNKTPMNVEIKVDSTPYGEGADTITFLQENLEKKFTCEAIEYNSLGEVKEIKFTTDIE